MEKHMQNRWIEPLKQGKRDMNGNYVCMNRTDPQWRKQSTGSSHQIKFHETKVTAKTSDCMNRLVKEAIAIKLYPDNINREEGFKLSEALYPSIRLLGGHSSAQRSGGGD
jgi:hypothetical protein